MPSEQTMELQAGRELDALVAEKVMGWPMFWLDPEEDGDVREPFEEHTGRPVPAYSTDIAAAWQVVEKLSAYIRLERFWDHTVRDTVWEAVISMAGRDARAHADTAPLAICRAALAAVEARHVR